MKAQFFGVVQEAVAVTDKNRNFRMRPPTPDASQITRMDEAYSWLSFIPDDKRVIRRIVALRSVVDPLSGKHLYTWTKVAAAVGCAANAAKAWHKQGVEMIAAVLSRQQYRSAALSCHVLT
jgi:hypothetical protein